MSYFTLKDGQRLYYEDKGHDSDTLIMMHGWTSTHLSGKTVYVFTTHCGSGMTDVVQRVQEFQPNADVRRGLAISRDNPLSSQDEVLQYIYSTQK